MFCKIWAMPVLRGGVWRLRSCFSAGDIGVVWRGALSVVGTVASRRSASLHTATFAHLPPAQIRYCGFCARVRACTCVCCYICKRRRARGRRLATRASRSYVFCISQSDTARVAVKDATCRWWWWCVKITYLHAPPPFCYSLTVSFTFGHLFIFLISAAHPLCSNKL